MMNNKVLKFVLFLILISLFLFFLGMIILQNIIPDFNIINLAGIIALFLIVTLIFHILLVNSSKKRVNKFVQRFLTFTSAKLLLYLIIIVAYIFLNKENAVPFLVIFLILYMIYTFFEIFSILKYIKSNSSE